MDLTFYLGRTLYNSQKHTELRAINLEAIEFDWYSAYFRLVFAYLRDTINYDHTFTEVDDA